MGFDGTTSTRSKNLTIFFNFPPAVDEEAEDFMAGFCGVLFPEKGDMTILKGGNEVIDIMFPMLSSTGLLGGEKSIPADR